MRHLGILSDFFSFADSMFFFLTLNIAIKHHLHSSNVINAVFNRLVFSFIFMAIPIFQQFVEKSFYKYKDSIHLKSAHLDPSFLNYSKKTILIVF